jgi:hypothetical protein
MQSMDGRILHPSDRSRLHRHIRSSMILFNKDDVEQSLESL